MVVNRGVVEETWWGETTGECEIMVGHMVNGEKKTKSILNITNMESQLYSIECTDNTYSKTQILHMGPPQTCRTTKSADVRPHS